MESGETAPEAVGLSRAGRGTRCPGNRERLGRTAVGRRQNGRRALRASDRLVKTQREAGRRAGAESADGQPPQSPEGQAGVSDFDDPSDSGQPVGRREPGCPQWGEWGMPAPPPAVRQAPSLAEGLCKGRPSASQGQWHWTGQAYENRCCVVPQSGATGGGGAHAQQPGAQGARGSECNCAAAAALREGTGPAASKKDVAQ